jgi:hypothetical protein
MDIKTKDFYRIMERFYIEEIFFLEKIVAGQPVLSRPGKKTMPMPPEYRHHAEALIPVLKELANCSKGIADVLDKEIPSEVLRPKVKINELLGKLSIDPEMKNN